MLKWEYESPVMNFDGKGEIAMNQSFYKSSSSEKLNNLRKEGMMSQAFYRSGASKASLLPKLSKLAIYILGIIGLLQIFAR